MNTHKTFEGLFRQCCSFDGNYVLETDQRALDEVAASAGIITPCLSFMVRSEGNVRDYVEVWGSMSKEPLRDTVYRLLWHGRS